MSRQKEGGRSMLTYRQGHHGIVVFIAWVEGNA